VARQETELFEEAPPLRGASSLCRLPAAAFADGIDLNRSAASD
jgi:hypothetical protein